MGRLESFGLGRPREGRGEGPLCRGGKAGARARREGRSPRARKSLFGIRRACGSSAVNGCGVRRARCVRRGVGRRGAGGAGRVRSVHMLCARSLQRPERTSVGSERISGIQYRCVRRGAGRRGAGGAGRVRSVHTLRASGARAVYGSLSGLRPGQSKRTTGEHEVCGGTTVRWRAEGGSCTHTARPKCARTVFGVGAGANARKSLR
jgi:hypothetical protein